MNSGTDSRPNVRDEALPARQEKKHKSTLHLYICLFVHVRGLASRFFSRKCLSVSSVNSGTDSRPNVRDEALPARQEKKHKSTLHLYICLFVHVRGLASRFFSRKCLSVSSVNSGTDSRPNVRDEALPARQEKKHKSTLHLYVFVFLYMLGV